LAESRSKRQRTCNGGVSVSVINENKPATSAGTSKCPTLHKLSHQTSSTDSQEDHSSQGPEPKPLLASVVRKDSLITSCLSVLPPTTLEPVDVIS